MGPLKIFVCSSSINGFWSLKNRILEKLGFNNIANY